MSEFDKYELRPVQYFCWRWTSPSPPSHGLEEDLMGDTLDCGDEGNILWVVQQELRAWTPLSITEQSNTNRDLSPIETSASTWPESLLTQPHATQPMSSPTFPNIQAPALFPNITLQGTSAI